MLAVDLPADVVLADVDLPAVEPADVDLPADADLPADVDLPAVGLPADVDLIGKDGS